MDSFIMIDDDSDVLCVVDAADEVSLSETQDVTAPAVAEDSMLLQKQIVMGEGSRNLAHSADCLSLRDVSSETPASDPTSRSPFSSPDISPSKTAGEGVEHEDEDTLVDFVDASGRVSVLNLKPGQTLESDHWKRATKKMFRARTRCSMMYPVIAAVGMCRSELGAEECIRISAFKGASAHAVANFERRSKLSRFKPRLCGEICLVVHFLIFP